MFEKRKYVIRSTSNNVYFNLAAEEYFVRHFDFSEVDLLFVYTNHPSVVLGKNQNIYKEVHIDILQTQELDIARRISGGGTVVHDMGNLNFSFLTAYDFSMVNKYSHSVGLVNMAINQMGIESIVNERNAILLPNGHKISGSAQFTCSNGILSHLTLLYQANLNTITRGIKPNNYKIKVTSSPSVRSSIDNLGHHLPLSQNEFLETIIHRMGYQENLELSEGQIAAIQQMVYEKYEKKEWVYDRSGQAKIKSKNIEIEIEDGKIVRTNPPLENLYGKRLLSDELGEASSVFEWLKVE
jgi:lipoate-protein ligase A